jgi:hypothetical protein
MGVLTANHLSGKTLCVVKNKTLKRQAGQPGNRAVAYGAICTAIGRVMAHPNLWGTTDTRNGLPTTTKEFHAFRCVECQCTLYRFEYTIPLVTNQ